MIASSGARPSVSGTNVKWNSVVTANCTRDRSRALTASTVTTGTGYERLNSRAWLEDMQFLLSRRGRSSRKPGA